MKNDGCDICGGRDSEYYVFQQAVKPKYQKSRYVDIGRCCDGCYNDFLVVRLEYEKLTAYVNSECFKSTNLAYIEALLNKKPIVEIAIRYWEKKNDLLQIRFFEDALEHINQRIKG